ncbi:MAG: hypothetical protein AAB116_23330 [Candidatus Poribacteria bacterium]
MPLLGDYIGILLSEIAIARLHADIESMRMAELYISHPLLKYMPVPHFRLPTLTLDVPLVIKEMDEVLSDSPRGKLDFLKMRKEFYQLFDLSLRNQKIQLTDSERKFLEVFSEQAMSRLRFPSSVYITVIPVVKELVSKLVEILSDPKRERGPVDPIVIEKFSVELEESIRVRFLNIRQEPPRLHVLVTTSEIKEAGPTDILANLHLSITEEAVEWTVIDVNGKPQDRLVPE